MFEVCNVDLLSQTKFWNVMNEYIGEIETILDNIWTCSKGGQSGLSDRKNEVGKWKEKQQNYLLLLIKHFKLYHTVLCKHKHMHVHSTFTIIRC